MQEKNRIIALRQHLHRFPELSNKEHKTAAYITDFMMALKPDRQISLGKTSRAFVFDGKEKGENLVFRAELDALAIPEISSVAYRSKNKGVAHLCGHDGHMAIVAALAEKIAENRPKSGSVAFLFQAAEEVEQGARDVVLHPNFSELNADYLFALHNIPGIPKNSIVMKRGSFAAASKGMTLILEGKTAHAAEPENGISPASAIAKIIQHTEKLNTSKTLFDNVCFLSIIHLLLGEIAFGTSPGYAEMRFTLRSFENQDMEKLTQIMEDEISIICQAENLQFSISYSEDFPACVNDDTCMEFLEKAVNENNLKPVFREKPFSWSEDFAYFAQEHKACLFGLGAGEKQASLHNPDYDFPDDIIETGASLFYTIYQIIQNRKK